MLCIWNIFGKSPNKNWKKKKFVSRDTELPFKPLPVQFSV